MTGKRIVLSTFGSFGDVHPYIAIALELKARGHHLVIATSEVYREKMDAAKLKAQFLGPSNDTIQTLMNTLEANVDEPITERGNDARMSYGDRFEVKFVKEDGVWKLKDLD